ncbi:MAG: chemotaxis protein CheC [Deltaproteobacteria bacterium]|nr:chemotaxis protein CheC [Deltaproteobacteria bacterium]MBW2117980.1 chemotaxis protein CheC [Deltaproteobacteria bacterium]
MDNFGILNKEQLDALKEVGTIGSGHAANALSQLAGRKIMISVPEVKAVPLKEVVELVGPPESIVAVVYMNLMGDAQGRSLLIFPRQSAFNLVDILMKRSAGQTKFLKEIDSSAIREVGNILTGAFLTTLADFLNIALIPSVPMLAYDMVGAILEALAIEFGEEADHIFCIQTEFTDPALDIGGNFILVFDRKSLDIMIEKIDMKIKEMTANKNRT